MEEFLCQTIYLLGSSVGRGYTRSFAPTKPVTNAMVHVTFWRLGKASKSGHDPHLVDFISQNQLNMCFQRYPNHEYKLLESNIR